MESERPREPERVQPVVPELGVPVTELVARALVLKQRAPALVVER